MLGVVSVAELTEHCINKIMNISVKNVGVKKMKIKTKNKHWFVWRIVNDEVEPYDIFRHKSFVHDIEQIDLQDEDFAEKVREELFYYFGGNYESEIEISNLLNEFRKSRKVDIYEQVMLNWARFIEYLKEEV